MGVAMTLTALAPAPLGGQTPLVLVVAVIEAALIALLASHARAPAQTVSHRACISRSLKRDLADAGPGGTIQSAPM